MTNRPRFHSFTAQDRAAFRILGLHEEAESYAVEQIDAAWRKLRSELHPDRGGDPGCFAATKRAYDIARFCSLEPKACLVCDGSGKVMSTGRRGFSLVSVNCFTCRGSGLR